MKNPNLINKICDIECNNENPPQFLKNNSEKKFYFILFLLMMLFLNIYVHFDELTSSLSIYGDMSNLYILSSLKDGSIFRNDFYGKFCLDVLHYLGIGYYLFSRLLILFFPLEFIFKIVPIFFNIIAVYFLFRIGSIIKDTKFGLIVGISSGIISLSMDSFFGYEQRIYGFTLFSIFLYFLIKKRVMIASFFSAISLFFYPYVFPYTALSCYLFILSQNKIYYRDKIKLIIIISTIFILCALLFKLGENTYIKKYGDFFSYKELQNMPEAGKEGSRPFVMLHKNYFLSNILNIYEHHEIYRKLLALFGIFIFLSLFIKNPGLKIPGPLIITLVSSLITFSIAHILYTKLGLRFIFASRFLIFTIPIFLAILFSFSLFTICPKFKINSLIFLFLLIVIFAINYESKPRNLNKYREIFNFFENVDKDCLIAGHPLGTEYIPLFSRRKIFIVSRMARPVNKFIWAESKKRLNDLFNAYYSNTIDESRKLCLKYHIDYLVVDEEYFGADYLDSKQLYFEPFDSLIREKIKTGKYALLEFAKKNYDIVSNGVYVVNCKRLNK